MQDLIDKRALHITIETEFSNLLDTAIKAAQQAHETATHEENKAENKYDTLGLEAAYLAEGQSRRVKELSDALAGFQKLPIKNFDEACEVDLGALIAVIDTHHENETDKIRYLFYSPYGGGIQIAFLDLNIMLITPVSPLGRALKNASLDDEVSFSQGDRKITYKVLGLW